MAKSDLRTSPILYKRYIDALVAKLLNGLQGTSDPGSDSCAQLAKQLQIQEDVCKAMGLKPHPKLLTHLRDLLEAWCDINHGGHEFDDHLAFKACMDYLESQAKELAALGIGVHISHAPSSTSQRPQLQLKFFAYSHKSDLVA